MKNEKLLKSLDMATDKAAILMVESTLKPRLSKKSTLIGTVLVEKNNSNLYDIIDLNRVPLYRNIFLFDIAAIIANRYINGDKWSVRKLLILEEKFSKYYTDMIHYLHCMKIAKKNKNYERLAILEDKFQTSEHRARVIRDNISLFKRLK